MLRGFGAFARELLLGAGVGVAGEVVGHGADVVEDGVLAGFALLDAFGGWKRDGHGRTGTYS